MGIPRQETTDLEDPKQRFVWAFQNMDYNGTPFMAPRQVLERWSEHLSACGFVHDPAQQSIHFQPPVRGQDHPFNTSGRWIPIEDPIEEPVVSSVELMTPQEKAKMIKELREEGLID